ASVYGLWCGAGVTWCRLTSFLSRDTASSSTYTLSLHDALPISGLTAIMGAGAFALALSGQALAADMPVKAKAAPAAPDWDIAFGDRKSTRLNSSHQIISYAVFCLKKKNTILRPLVSHVKSHDCS